MSRENLGLLVSILIAVVIGIAATFFPSTPGIALFSTIVSTAIGVTVTRQQINKQQQALVTQVKYLESCSEKNQQLVTLERQVTALKAEVETLEANRQLNERLEITNARLKGEYQQQKNILTENQQAIANLTQQRQELETRIAAIQRQNPELSQQEALQRDIEALRMNRQAIEVQLQSLQSQLELSYSQQKQQLQLEAEIAFKQENLAHLKAQVEKLTAQAQEWETRATELELLRATYDGLSSERQELESRIGNLKPEVERLQLEQQTIWQAIQAQEQEYRQVEELREQLRRLRHQRQESERNLHGLEQDVSRLHGTILALHTEKTELETQIRQIKGEIDKASNSVDLALSALTKPQWEDLPPSPLPFVAESEFISNLTRHLQTQGLAFPERVIRAFHTSLKVQDFSALVILAGISGTGKSQLPKHYADYIGAQHLTLSVQPRWDSPQDLQGFYNYIEQKFKPTDLMRGLWQYQSPQMQDRIVLVLLDEMNLARVEYYFSDFLSKLEFRRYGEVFLELELGSLSVPDTERRLRIPQQFLFVGTMNEDETTQSLSDKVLDRANVITFGRPHQLQPQTNIAQFPPPSKYLTYSQFLRWRKPADSSSSIVNKLADILSETNEIMERMEHPFAHRVYQSITHYVVNYPGVTDINSEAFRHALADQFGQKLLPKLRGVMLDGYQDELAALRQVIESLEDHPLNQAFEKAQDPRYGQFRWSGLVYEN